MEPEIKKFINCVAWSGFAIFLGMAFPAFVFNFVGFGGRVTDVLTTETYAQSMSEVQRANFASPIAVPDFSVFDEYKKVSLLFVGDIMLDRGVRKSIEENGGGDFSYIFKKAGFLKKADITFGNLEGPVSDTGSDRRNLYSFRMPPAAFETIRKVGFDALSVANNHAGDWGREAFEDALFRLKNEEILAVGGGWNREDAEKVKIIEKNGIKFGFLGFTDVGPKWLEVEDDKAGILIVKKGYLDIVKKASKEVDYLIVSFHFGKEYQTKPNQRQMDIAEAVIDSGAKIVVGHHPHVVQPIRNYHGGIIAYSLGNFIFDQYFSKETMQGMVLEVIVDKNGIIEVSKELVNLNKFYQPSL